jgi:hypothetical protein
MARPAPADIPEIYAQQPQPGFDPFGDLKVLRDIQPGADIFANGFDAGLGSFNFAPVVPTTTVSGPTTSKIGLTPEQLAELSDEELEELFDLEKGVLDAKYQASRPETIRDTTKLNRIFEDISQQKDFLADIRAEFESRGLKIPVDPTPYGGQTGIVFGPRSVTGTVVFGDEPIYMPNQDTGIYTGSYKIPGGIIVDTGVSTGSAVLDDIIKGGVGQEVGGEVTITDVGLEEIARRTGIPVDDIAEILKNTGLTPSAGGTQQTQTAAQTGGATTQTRSQTGGAEEDTEGGGPFTAPVTVAAGTNALEELLKILRGDSNGSSSTGADTVDSGSTTDTVTTNGGATTDTTTTTSNLPTVDTVTSVDGALSTPSDITIDTPADIIAGGGPDTLTTGPSDIVTNGGGATLKAGTPGDMAAVVNDSLVSGPSDTTIEAGSTIQTGGGGGFGMPTETPSATGQGLTGVSTEKAGVADIGDPYQLSASLYENIMRILQQDRENRRDDRNRARTYYGGGSVRASDRIDEIARIIRG